MIIWIGIVLLFLLGVRLSSFFSGIETAFYRASKLRLNIDAQTGDHLSQNILNYASNPSRFVATILIGNNIANYVTTCAISYGAIHAFGALSEATEVGVTIAISPVIFIFGELLPKTLHYQAPLTMLKRYFFFFRIVHILIFPLSWPLMLLTNLLQKLGGDQRQPMLRILGRRPLANVIGQGREEGVVTGVQHELIQGIFVNANRKLEQLIIPREIAFSFEADLTRAKLMDHAQSFGLIDISVIETIETEQQPCYYRVTDLLLTTSSLTEIRCVMPRINSLASRLEALLILNEAEAELGAIYKKKKLIGIVRRQVLAETLFQGGLSTELNPA